MEKWIGGVLLDVSPPERAKFKAPLILTHGVWSSSRAWQRWATHFSNLGWECWAVNWRGRFGENAAAALKRLSFDDCVADLKEVIRAAPFPPVLAGHDLGALIALKAAAEEKVSALILLAPLPPKDLEPEPPRALRLLRLKYRPLLFLRRAFRLEEKDFRRHWLNALPERGHDEAIACLVADSPHLIADFFARRALDAQSSDPAVLVVGGADDRIVAPSALGDLARSIGADCRVYSGHGHWILGEEGGEEIVRDMHRWIVRQAGASILLEEKEENS